MLVGDVIELLEMLHGCWRCYRLVGDVLELLEML
jgi:hypothetical protein